MFDAAATGNCLIT